LEELKDVELKLISGYPNIQFRYAKSLLSPNVTLSDFFKGLDIEPSTHKYRSVVTNQRVLSNHAYDYDDDYDIERKNIYPSDDIYITDIGQKYLLLNDTYLLQVAKANTSFKKVVEWFIPDYRHIDGSIKRSRYNSEEPEVWDSILFCNPFQYPLTTGAAEIVENNTFRGQSIIYWSNPDDEILLRVTKALSFKNRAFEKEKKDSREIVNWGGNEYQKTNVEGELHIINKRNEKIEVIIKKHFTGNIINADDKPKLTLKEDGVISANPKNELRWKINLEPNEEKVLKYKYNVLVLIDD